MSTTLIERYTVSENTKNFGVGYVKNSKSSLRAGRGGVAIYTDAFGNKVELGTFTEFDEEATDEQKYAFYSNEKNLYLGTNGSSVEGKKENVDFIYNGANFKIEGGISNWGIVGNGGPFTVASVTTVGGAKARQRNSCWISCT